MNKDTLDSIPPLLDTKHVSKLLGVSYNYVIANYTDEEHGAVKVGKRYIFDRDKLLKSIGIKVS